MAAVKGSKQLRMVVVPYRPWRLWWLGSGLALLLLVTALGAWWLGQQQALQRAGDARVERDRLQQELAVLEEERLRLQQQVLNLEQASMVDKEALSSVQGTMVALRGQISQLEEDLLFYKQILTPDNDSTGLVVGTLDLRPGKQAGGVRFKLELKQQGNTDKFINGHVKVNVLGLQHGESVALPLHSLSDAVEAADIRLRFRYFQNVEGELLLPAEFEPQRVQVVAVAQGDNARTVEKSFIWRVQD
jgi:cell division protein FtsB